MKPRKTIHCTCGAYRLVCRETMAEVEAILGAWWRDHIVEHPELNHAQTDRETADKAREFIRVRKEAQCQS